MKHFLFQPLVVASLTALFVFILLSCAPAEPSSQPPSYHTSIIFEESGLSRVVDQEYGIVCYFSKINITSLSCAPIGGK